ncbi:hypothetical protein BCR34DRAFT_592827 [Clohesyomyces aquaticus]|uniref:Uncharacterized protein n=1 Tax=Clohesyomyces aquaticus TaxID=1231657 RepID=A0A1Y1YNW1_9PLEO|nr:hypothetical protein BCR34DRAFT_592827 [Clohesyomyces aquaticus]
MSAAHGCIRSALAQAFRSPSQVAVSLPDFLIPALSHSKHRCFATSRSARAVSHPASLTHSPSSTPAPSSIRPKIVRRDPIPFRIPLPDRDSGRHMQSWLTAIDPFLPPHLRQQPGEEGDTMQSATSLDFSRIINVAQDASQDILSHMGLVEGRWDAVVWLVKKLVEGFTKPRGPPIPYLTLGNVAWPAPGPGSLSLAQVTQAPIRAARSPLAGKLAHSLDELTGAQESIGFVRNTVKRAFGQVWRSLGNMILEATKGSNEEKASIMSRVLEVIAYLHHSELIPDSIYKFRPDQNDHALQQPPTLHFLSSQILTALSDASWRAHESSVKVAKQRLNAQYFLGHEIPGSRYKLRVAEVAPELWLELVLWSCLHGGWILDGTEIVEKMASLRGESEWKLISWRELIKSKEEESSKPGRGWSLFGKIKTEVEDRTFTRRTISCEVVTAFVDGLVNTMRVGVGTRGTDPELIVEHIKKLKHLMDRNALSLGSASWDSVMVRLLETGGMVPEKRPELLLSIIDLASGFGAEVGSANASSPKATTEAEPPYFFDASAVPIGFLHRSMRSFVDNGDLGGMVTTLKRLHDYTDNNRQTSLREFFKKLKNTSLQQEQPFTSTFAPIEYPGFDHQLPIPLLAKILDLATEARLFDLGRSLLFCEDIDGPLISPSMYHDWGMAASIMRFGSLAREKKLVLKIVEMTESTGSGQQAGLMHPEMLNALLSTQIQLHRWDSVRGMQDYVLEKPGYRPRPEILANFAAALCRLSSDLSEYTKKQKAGVRTAFTEFLFAWEALILTNMRNELNCSLGILSSVDPELKTYCSEFLAFSTRQTVKLPADDFNRILGGVLDGFGSRRGREVVDMWCYRPPRTFEPFRAPGGLPTMPRIQVGKGDEYEARPEDITIAQPSGAMLVLQGRVGPNRQTVFAVLRKVQQEQVDRKKTKPELTVEELAEVRTTLKWAAKFLYYLGYDYEDIIKDLGVLAELAELEAPPEVKIAGLDPDPDRDGYRHINA